LQTSLSGIPSLDDVWREYVQKDQTSKKMLNPNPRERAFKTYAAHSNENICPLPYYQGGKILETKRLIGKLLSINFSNF
jgi:hypothetical protein